MKTNFYKRVSKKKVSLCIESLWVNNFSCDSAYQDVCSHLGLFGYAFYGWSCDTKYQKQLLSDLWKVILHQNILLNDNLRKWQKEQTINYLNT